MTTLTSLCEKTDNDIRSCLNTLQVSANIQGRCLLNADFKVFSPALGHMEKVDLNKGYHNPQRKLGVAMHFSKIISLEL